ncbi:MAG: hypothetical protein LBC43_02350 [Bifidobacteriaceae bacterium]|nr:hypothetical protein [Bifidobacteriaceae bacterium]
MQWAVISVTICVPSTPAPAVSRTVVSTPPPAWPIKLENTLPAQPQSTAVARYNYVKDLPTLGELN